MCIKFIVHETVLKHVKTARETKYPTKNKRSLTETMRNILPTCSRLNEKGIEISHGCYFYEDPSKTIWHLMRSRPYSK